MADVSRATVELSAETLANGVVVDRQKSTYQIASIHPNKFTVYLKQPDQRTRVYCNGESMVIALAPDAYFRMPNALETQVAVFDPPVPLGPYPEAVMSLTLAGADPALSMLGGMESVEIVDRSKFRGKIDSIHLKGVQDDGVEWDFWITQGKNPKPLRLLVNLTSMLRDNAQMQMPEGYSYELRFDFLAWRMTGEVDEKLFSYKPAADATEYESLEDYYEQIAGAASRHPLLGKAAPKFEAKLLSGNRVTPKDLAGKIVVMDFWASWCTPCVEAMPVLQDVCAKHAQDDVVLVAINVGEDLAKVKEYAREQGWKNLNIILDEDMKVSKQFTADVIPLTMVISKKGIVESMHFGYAGAEALEERLIDEIEVLAQGGIIESAEPVKTKQTKAEPQTPPQKKTSGQNLGGSKKQPARKPAPAKR